MENYQLKPLQTGHYLKVVDGEVLGEATPGEVRCYDLRKKFPAVEAGFLEVSLALAGVTGVLSTFSNTPVVRAFSVAAFFLSMLGAYNLTWLYIQPRLPITWTHYLASPLKQRYPWFPLTIWLPFYFFKRAVQLSISSKDEYFEQGRRGSIAGDQLPYALYWRHYGRAGAGDLCAPATVRYLFIRLRRIEKENDEQRKINPSAEARPAPASGNGRAHFRHAFIQRLLPQHVSQAAADVRSFDGRQPPA
jgi:hypothetical protein